MAPLKPRPFKTQLAASPLKQFFNRFYGNQGRDQDAEGMFRAALSSAPGMVKAMVNRAATLASEGHMTEAADRIDKALALPPGNKEAIQLRSMIQSALRPTSRLEAPAPDETGRDYTWPRPFNAKERLALLP